MRTIIILIFLLTSTVHAGGYYGNNNFNSAKASASASVRNDNSNRNTNRNDISNSDSVIIEGDDYEKPSAIAPSIGFAIAGDCIGAGGSASFGVRSFGFGGSNASLDQQCVKVRNLQLAIEYANSGLPSKGQQIVINRAIYNAILDLDGMNLYKND